VVSFVLVSKDTPMMPSHLREGSAYHFLIVIISPGLFILDYRGIVTVDCSSHVRLHREVIRSSEIPHSLRLLASPFGIETRSLWRQQWVCGRSTPQSSSKVSVFFPSPASNMELCQCTDVFIRQVPCGYIYPLGSSWIHFADFMHSFALCGYLLNRLACLPIPAIVHSL
jgi:hypothetical protein